MAWCELQGAGDSGQRTADNRERRSRADDGTKAHVALGTVLPRLTRASEDAGGSARRTRYCAELAAEIAKSVAISADCAPRLSCRHANLASDSYIKPSCHNHRMLMLLLRLVTKDGHAATQGP